jgi:transcriptional regulator with XRE-family HTH domain
MPMKNDMPEIVARIKGILEQRGDSQSDLAQVLGVDESAVSRLMAGNRGLAAAELAALCDHYGVRSDTILFGAPQEMVGALLRADADTDARRVIERVEEAFTHYRYVRALVGG